MTVWIDADACPRTIKAFVFKACARLKAPVVVVANRGLGVPQSPLIRQVVVGGAIDEADRYILEHAAARDLVVTEDIPLASALVDKGVAAVSPRGVVFTPNNVKEALATRNLMQELRESGLAAGGPAPLVAAHRVAFANAFDREMTRLARLPG
ncbi:MAG: YaiI/YqxD family protein [Candidatus Lambdaproteobacteria bacterium]|nr:YaiI/YqxD family protein [Candidatus Lambdaproteobacteria bacterium]